MEPVVTTNRATQMKPGPTIVHSTLDLPNKHGFIDRFGLHTLHSTHSML